MPIVFDRGPPKPGAPPSPPPNVDPSLTGAALVEAQVEHERAVHLHALELGKFKNAVADYADWERQNKGPVALESVDAREWVERDPARYSLQP